MQWARQDKMGNVVIGWQDLRRSILPWDDDTKALLLMLFSMEDISGVDLEKFDAYT